MALGAGAACRGYGGDIPRESHQCPSPTEPIPSSPVSGWEKPWGGGQEQGQGQRQAQPGTRSRCQGVSGRGEPPTTPPPEPWRGRGRPSHRSLMPLASLLIDIIKGWGSGWGAGTGVQDTQARRHPEATSGQGTLGASFTTLCLSFPTHRLPTAGCGVLGCSHPSVPPCVTQCPPVSPAGGRGTRMT